MADTPHVTPAAPQPANPPSNSVKPASAIAKPKWDPSYKFDPMTGEPIRPPVKIAPQTGKAANDGLYDHLIGLTDLQPGENAWLLLDAAGAGVSLQRDPPDPGIPACAVRVNANQQGGTFQGLLSITGSELGPVLQPNPDNRLVPEVIPLGAAGSTPQAGWAVQPTVPPHVAAAATAPKEPKHAEPPKK